MLPHKNEDINRTGSIHQYSEVVFVAFFGPGTKSSEVLSLESSKQDPEHVLKKSIFFLLISSQVLPSVLSLSKKLFLT